MEKRERGSNFTEYDKELLLDLVTNSYFTIIENKKTDGATLKEKAKAWEEIAAKYNAATTNERRTELSLKTAYTNFKRKLKKQTCVDDNSKITRYRPIAPKPRPDETNTIRLINLLKQHNPVENRLDASTNYFITDSVDLAEIKMEAEEEIDDIMEVKSVDITSIINKSATQQESKGEDCSYPTNLPEPSTSESDESCSSKRKRSDAHGHSKKSKSVTTTTENETQTLTVIKSRETEVIDALRVQQETEKLKQEQEKLKQEMERTKQEIIKTKLLELQLNKANLNI